MFSFLSQSSPFESATRSLVFSSSQNEHCENPNNLATVQPINKLPALAVREYQQSSNVNNSPGQLGLANNNSMKVTEFNSHYEHYIPSELCHLTSSGELGFTSPVPKSPLKSVDLSMIRTPCSHISNKSFKITDTPYRRIGTSMPYLAGSVLDMRLCSSPRPQEGSMQLISSSDLNGEVYNLPNYESLKDAIRRISSETMMNVLTGQYTSMYDDLIIIDCRYPYEYSGGHIPGSLNVNTPDSIDRLLLKGPVSNRHTCIIFHCEFSSQRAPRMALHVRNFDRLLNADRYPRLYYPEIYILDGGYKAFFDIYAVHSFS